MAKLTFKFGNPERGGNSLLKLIVYFHENGKAETVYSFDGRYHQTSTPRFTDETKHWNEDNARRYLQTQFADKFQHAPRLKYAAIVDSRYPTGKKYRVWDIASQTWTSPEAANAQLHTQHIAARQQRVPQLYSFRLSIPLLKRTPTQTVKWINFFTERTQAGMAMVDLIGQFHAWQKLTPSVRPQNIGQFLGKVNGQFSTDEANVPRFAWFDVLNSKPKYHGTQRVVLEYVNLQEVYGNFEETISNYMA